jgi:hypothetical protein
VDRGTKDRITTLAGATVFQLVVADGRDKPVRNNMPLRFRVFDALTLL